MIPSDENITKAQSMDIEEILGWNSCLDVRKIKKIKMQGRGNHKGRFQITHRIEGKLVKKVKVGI